MENNPTKKRVLVKKVREDAIMPAYADSGAAGFDLVAMEDVIVSPGEVVKVPTGLAFAIPQGYEVQVRPRSGLSLKTYLRVILGTVDSSYRGEVNVIVQNSAPTSLELYESLGYSSRIHEVYSTSATALDGTVITSEREYPANSYIIFKGDRIAQGVLNAAPTASFEEVAELDDTERGTGGFGSTGI